MSRILEQPHFKCFAGQLGGAVRKEDADYLAGSAEIG